jgi:hypothetical protein
MKRTVGAPRAAPVDAGFSVEALAGRSLAPAPASVSFARGEQAATARSSVAALGNGHFMRIACWLLNR